MSATLTRLTIFFGVVAAIIFSVIIIRSSL